jgi:hypothetical protein
LPGINLVNWRRPWGGDDGIWIYGLAGFLTNQHRFVINNDLHVGPDFRL